MALEVTELRRVMGIDAGFTATGIVVVELVPYDLLGRRKDRVAAAVTVRTTPDGRRRGLRVADSDAERCQLVARAILDTAREWHVEGVVTELPNAGAQGARPNRSMGMATGVVAACVEAMVLPAEWVTPFDVKRVATGRRDGSKEDVQAAVYELFEWAPGTIGLHKWQKEHTADGAGAVRAAERGVLIRGLRGRAAA